MIILLLLLIQSTFGAFTLPFNTGSVNKHGLVFSDAPCNANTVIDFAFSPNSVLIMIGDAVILPLLRA